MIIESGGQLQPVFYTTGSCVCIFAKLDIWNVCYVFTFVESNKKVDSNSSTTDLYLGGAISNLGWETKKMTEVSDGFPQVLEKIQGQ